MDLGFDVVVTITGIVLVFLILILLMVTTTSKPTSMVFLLFLVYCVRYKIVSRKSIWVHYTLFSNLFQQK